MLANGQTLRHKKTSQLVRLDPEPGEMWIGEKTAFIARDGTIIIDDIKNYTHVEDELGRPYCKMPAEGQFVDESAEKYLISSRKMAKMRQKRLKEWEAKVLDRMSGNVKTFTYICNGKSTISTCDSPRKSVHCPFADGSEGGAGFSSLFRDFFLKRRGATPLYKVWNSIRKEYTLGPMVFEHTDGQIWLYDEQISRLDVIKDIVFSPQGMVLYARQDLDSKQGD